MTIADLAIWRLCGWFQGGLLDGIPGTLFDEFPCLQAHYECIDADTRIREWMRANYG